MYNRITQISGQTNSKPSEPPPQGRIRETPRRPLSETSQILTECDFRPLSLLSVSFSIDGLCRLRLASLNRLREVIVGDHLVVPPGDALSVADPGTDDMLRMLVGQVRPPTGSEVMKDTRPGSEPCTPHQASHLRSEVSKIPVPVNNKLGTFGRFFKGIPQEWHKLWKQWNHSFCFTDVFGFWTHHIDSANVPENVPENVLPSQGKML